MKIIKLDGFIEIALTNGIPPDQNQGGLCVNKTTTWFRTNINNNWRKTGCRVYKLAENNKTVKEFEEMVM